MADTTAVSAPNANAASASNNDNSTTFNSTTTNNNNNNNTNQSQQNSSPMKNPGANPATPSAGAPAATTATNENRGLPYYEKLRRELRDTLQKKRLMDKSMVCYNLLIKGGVSI
jgi:chromatin modification-related protein EAF6